MRRLTTAALVASSLLALVGCSSYSAEDCQKALANGPIKKTRPAECQDISEEDYDVLLMNESIRRGLSEMSKEDRDLLDYSDDGSINGSISGD